MGRPMKDSGVEWIGEIPESWSVRSIKRSFRVESGATPRTEIPDYWNGTIPWITPADYKTQDEYVFAGRSTLTQAGLESCGTTMIPENSLIFSKRAPVGLVAINTTELCTNQGCLSCIPYGENSVTYFYYVMSTYTEQFELVSAGTTFKEISLTEFRNFVLPYPPTEEQAIIAAYLDKQCRSIDTTIDKTTSSIEEYKKLKQAIITQAVTKGVRGERPMKDSGVEWIGEIPEEWETCRIKNVIFPKEKPVREDDEIITCFRDGTVTLRKNRREDGFTVSLTEHGYHGVDVGDLVIHGMDAFAGAIGCSDSRGKTTPVVHVCSTSGDNRYFMYFLRSMAYGNILMDLSNGVRIRSSDYRNFAKLGVFGAINPPITEQREIADYLDTKCAAIDALIVQKQQLLTELQNYKKSLIYEYVTGKKEVPAV